MTKKDYKLIAAAIARARRVNAYAAPSAMAEAYALAINMVVTTLAADLKGQRAEFSREKFAAACLED